MTNFKKLLNYSLAVVFIAGAIGFTGCSGVSEEQMAELQALKTEVNALQKEVDSLKSEKTQLERQIAEKNAKLDQCAKEKEETQANLKKMGM